MKLNKRIYLLTPLLVLVCVIAAGAFMKAPAKVEAETYLINKGSYEAVKLAEVIDFEKKMTAEEWEIYKAGDTEDNPKYKDIVTKYSIPDGYDQYIANAEKYDIKNFNTVLFDYNGYEFNRFFVDHYNYIYAFKFGNVTNNTKAGYTSYFGKDEIYTKSDGSKVTIQNYDTDINAGGYPVKQGILKNELFSNESGYTSGYDKGLPDFAQFGNSTDWQGSKRAGSILFDPELKTLTEIKASSYWQNYKYENYGISDEETLEAIRKVYPASFQFVHDTQTGYYTYNSSLNHAQYNDGKKEVELYADTLGMTNGTKNQMPLIEGDADGDGVGEMAYCSKVSGHTQTYIDYETNPAVWENAGSTVGESTLFKIYPGTDSNSPFTPSLKIRNFIVPTNEQNAEEISEQIDANNVEYIYINFKINYNKNSSGSSDNKFRIVLTEIDKNFYTEVPYKNKSGGGVEGPGTCADNADKGLYKYYTYVYDYAHHLVTDTNNRLNTGDIELKIPVDRDTIGFDNVSQITIIPFKDNGTLKSEYGDTGYVYFKLYDFGIGYATTDAEGNKKDDLSSISSFLPFHKIENSYEGEISGEANGADLKTYMDTWATKVGTDSSNRTANRAIVNDYYNDGLTAVDKNDFGGTAAHFGMSMEIPFYIPADRTTGKDGDNDNKKDDIVFEFTGDDDLWVFVDGQLVLDIGGNHLARTGTVNFTKGTVTYDRAPVVDISIGNPKGNVTDIYMPNATDEIKSLGTSMFSSSNGKGNTKADFFAGPTVDTVTDGAGETVNLKDLFDVGEHIVQIFYLERASGMSNCFITFNLPQIPEGGIVVSNEIELAEDSEIKEIPTDLNGDGIEDKDITVVNIDGKLSYQHNGTDKPNGLVAFEYIAEFTVISAYDIDGSLPKFKGTYNLYKKDDGDSLVKDLALEILEHTKGSEENKYIVRFYVPVGYTASILLPDESEIINIREVDPSFKDVGISHEYVYSSTNIDLDLKYLIKNNNNEMTEESAIKKFEGVTDPSINKKPIEGYPEAYYVVGSDTNDVSSLNSKFTNYIKSNLYELEIEKTFLDGKPVPVGQSILYTVECGLTHSEGVTCDNPLCGNPLYISMLIKDTKDANGDPLPENPNKVIVRDLPKGNYKITEKADWSWRYECYNVEVQRNDAEQYGDGTVISAATSTPAP